MNTLSAKDLRVGNLVKAHGHENAVHTIGEIGINKMPGLTYDKLQPIPLTNEWLEQFGFMKGNLYTGGEPHYKFPNHHSNDYLCKDGNGYDWHVNSGDEWGNTVTPLVNQIKYVHQLQNLYWSLTGEELTIKHHE